MSRPPNATYDPDATFPELGPGDTCPYCARDLKKLIDIVNCYICCRQGCGDCIGAGACCLEDSPLEEC